MTELTHCCGHPPRLISGEGIGYTIVCMECGRGLSGLATPSSTYQAAEAFWTHHFQYLTPLPRGATWFILEKLNEAQEALRGLAYRLGMGGYNATYVNAKVFERKIHEGIDGLTSPLLKMLEDRDKRIKELENELGSKAEVISITPKFDDVVITHTNGWVYTLTDKGVVYINNGIWTTTNTLLNCGSVAFELFDKHLETRKINVKHS